MSMCRKNGIEVTAYASLARGELLKDRDVLAVAKQEQSSAPTVLLRWALQQGLCVIPKTSKVKRVASFEPRYLFDQPLSTESMVALTEIGKRQPKLKTCWDPDDVV